MYRCLDREESYYTGEENFFILVLMTDVTQHLVDILDVTHHDVMYRIYQPLFSKPVRAEIQVLLV